MGKMWKQGESCLALVERCIRGSAEMERSVARFERCAGGMDVNQNVYE